jgi:uncharacterized protein with FMN-binding domain
MKRAVTATMLTLALATPVANAIAATPKKKVTTTTKTISGSVVEVDRWGSLQVTVVLKKTTTTVGAKKTVKRRVTAVRVPTYPNHTDRSVFINQNALPTLVQEALTAQFAGSIDMVSGATDTSYGFEQSLQSALLAAKKA